MKNINIRFLSSADALSFKNLRIKSLRDDPDSWLSSMKEESALTDAAFASKIASAYGSGLFGYYGYFENNQLVAHSQLASGYWNKKRHIANLFDVCVSPDQRRKGVGTKLINFIIEKVKSSNSEIEQIHLKVNSRNSGGSIFYETLGFEKVATLKDAVKEKDGSYQDEYLFVIKI